MRSLKGFILAAAIVASLLLFAVAYGVTGWISHRYVHEDAKEDAQFLAEQTFSSMFQIMRKGWSRQEVEAFLRSLERSTRGKGYDIDVYRGAQVETKFGSIQQGPKPAGVDAALGTGEPQRRERANRLTFVKPLKARSDCLRCHTNAQNGDILGAIRVRQDVAPQVANAREDFRTAFGLIAQLPLGVAVGVAAVIGRRIDRSVGRLRQSIEQVTKVADLSQVEERVPRAGFIELDRLADQVRELSGRLRNIAVDRDLLEFEIRLLEKFVITSDVVRDWQDYIKTLLVEINSVMEAYLLFSLFKVEEEA